MVHRVGLFSVCHHGCGCCGERPFPQVNPPAACRRPVDDESVDGGCVVDGGPSSTTSVARHAPTVPRTSTAGTGPSTAVHRLSTELWVVALQPLPSGSYRTVTRGSLCVHRVVPTLCTKSGIHRTVSTHSCLLLTQRHMLGGISLKSPNLTAIGVRRPSSACGLWTKSVGSRATWRASAGCPVLAVRPTPSGTVGYPHMLWRNLVDNPGATGGAASGRADVWGAAAGPEEGGRAPRHGDEDPSGRWGVRAQGGRRGEERRGAERTAARGRVTGRGQPRAVCLIRFVSSVTWL